MTIANLQTFPVRQPPPIRIAWDHVEQLMRGAGIPNDAELARRGAVAQSTITRARDGAASPSAIRALKRAFPDASLDDLVIVPRDSDT